MLDETEIDRRALLRFLAATTDPPRRVWKPVGNWRAPDTAEDVTQWSGVRTELFPRVRTHDEKTGELLTPVRVPRVTYLDASNKQAQGEFPGAAAFALYGWLLSHSYAADAGRVEMRAPLPDPLEAGTG